MISLLGRIHARLTGKTPTTRQPLRAPQLAPHAHLAWPDELTMDQGERAPEHVRSALAAGITLRITPARCSASGGTQSIMRGLFDNTTTLADLVQRITQHLDETPESAPDHLPLSGPDVPLDAHCLSCGVCLLDADVLKNTLSYELMMTRNTDRNYELRSGEQRMYTHMTGPLPRSFCSLTHALDLLSVVPDETHLWMVMDLMAPGFALPEHERLAVRQRLALPV